MQTIAVLGANGRLSSAAARAFHASGCRVVAVTRSGNAKGLAGDIEQRAADAMDREALIRATKGADFIFNGLNPVYTQWKKLVMPMGENVMAAAREHGAIHLFPGNVYNYGRSIAPHVHDDEQQHAQTRKGGIRIRLEKFFEDQAKTNGVQTIILRAGDFYGGSVTGSWFDLVIAAKIAKGVYTYPGPGQVPHSWAYLPDLADTFVRLADKADELKPFSTFLFPGHTMTGEELKHHCEVAVGAPLKAAGVPWTLLKLGGLVVPMLREVSEMAYLWKVPHSLDGKALEAAIGPVPHTDPQRAVAVALSDLGVRAVRSKQNIAVAAA
ncbi:MAG: NAD-dependent epimerase/dehydratase family protein [Hyphomicrobiales bacterium]|nr:NAD-dependent epimerase/dehydratase family protein [Hyphomicrobiales bacterium]MCP4998484.1 NAD-dependent epimerase/dehydratase family protein [Hyphomicrobiales bacterium]